MRVFYKLDGRNPVPCEIGEYAAMFIGDPELRRVALTEIDGWRVSTVFLGQQGQFFETMIFADNYFDRHQVHADTWDDALLAHDRAIEIARKLNTATLTACAQPPRNSLNQPTIVLDASAGRELPPPRSG